MFWCSIHAVKFLVDKANMNKQTRPIAQVFRFDSPFAIWKFMNWLPVLLIWPYLLVTALLDVGFSWIGLGGFFVCWATIFTAYYILRSVLISRGAVKSDLDAISNGVCRSCGASALIGVPIALATLVSISLFTKAIGTYEAFVNETNLIVQFLIAVTIVVVSAYIGWRIKGRSVYEKHLPEPASVGSK